ncbi:SGNH/GDSL hydrolase family protein [Blastochloris tepida]|uniref:SGNH hydrolase-type esterase domain-containing protein n=1 Tax=Blastochloris tepida TaxID=2233851 RepID=A0A348G2T5_9HYPH|nr:SGNH/GDSL hydrolase family protein [Blastochloris tepida]BBF93868.1 hypothetical protein BLTE_25530 [Blastochloris tepida]
MRRIITIALLIAIAVVGAEAFARFGLGLGDPPLTVIDAELEYIFRPGRTYERFGNIVSYNSKSMRASEVPPAKNGDDFRVLVLGDSVVNGGALTDQKDISSEVLARKIGANAWVGNISAGSWGPANLLAYVTRHGWFDADAALIVVSTHDLEDLPEFRVHYGDDFPEESPMSALSELITRYLPRHIPALGPYLRSEPSPPSVTYSPDERRQKGEAALRDLIAAAQKNVRNVVLVLHPTRTETAGAAEESEIEQRARLTSIVKSTGVPMFDVETVAGWKTELYRDDIHPNAAGQAAYATIFECLLKTFGGDASVDVCRSSGHVR